MLPLKPPYNILHFVNVLLSANICAFWDMKTFLHSHPIFSMLLNLTFLTSETQKFKFDKFLPHALSPTQNVPKEPKRSQINPHLDHETAVYILLEDAAYWCFDLARTDLAHLSPNRATHLKSPKKYCVKARTTSIQQRTSHSEALSVFSWNIHGTIFVRTRVHGWCPGRPRQHSHRDVSVATREAQWLKFIRTKSLSGSRDMNRKWVAFILCSEVETCTFAHEVLLQ